jgi:hypothetical protein
MVSQVPNVIDCFFQPFRLVNHIDRPFVNNRFRLNFASENPYPEQTASILETYAVASFGFQFIQSRNNPTD